MGSINPSDNPRVIVIQKLYGHHFNKDFALASDRTICLKDGQYRVHFASFVSSSATATAWCYIRLNGQNVSAFYVRDLDYTRPVAECIMNLRVGDYIQVVSFASTHGETEFNITRIK